MPVSKKRGLGRSFESLIPTDLLDESFDPTASQDQKVSELRQVKISEISANPDQPRKNFDSEEMKSLTDSVIEYGVLQPIILSPYKGGYRIVAGERRFHAAKAAGLDKIPALVRTLDNQRNLEVSLIENIQRQNLNVVEVATAYLKLQTQFNMTTEQIAKRVGAGGVSTIANKIRLLKLPKFAKDLLVEGVLTEGQVRPLAGVDEKILQKVIPRIVKEHWSARRVEQFTVDLSKNSRTKEMPVSHQIKEQPYKKQLKSFKQYLKADVSISTTTRGSGRITIKFKNEDEFERLQKLLSSD